MDTPDLASGGVINMHVEDTGILLDSQVATSRMLTEPPAGVSPWAVVLAVDLNFDRARLLDEYKGVLDGQAANRVRMMLHPQQAAELAEALVIACDLIARS